MRYCYTGIGIWLCLLMLASCSDNVQISGAGGQTTNGITASVVYPGGKTAVNIPFKVRPAEYLIEINNAQSLPHRSIVNGMTDTSGVFRIDSLESGDYVIEINDGKGFAIALKRHIPDSIGIIDAGTNTLSPTGAVRGYLSQDELNSNTWYVQIYGLERITTVDPQSGYFAFSDLPAGDYTFRYLSQASATAPIEISNINVHSDDTTIVPVYPSWRFNAKFTLNTSSSGADIQENVFDFPVLIRLTKNNFDFSQAKANGEDIRFSKAGGSQLPYEIERWDASGQSAEIWIKIDTVYGNNQTQDIIMYWGNPTARPQSNSTVVFDTTNGFAGVWHLSETTGTNAADATISGNFGVYKGNLPNYENSHLGICQNVMKPDSDYVNLGNILNPGMKNISISIWIKRGSMTYPQALIAKTKGDLPSKGYGYLLSIDPGSYPHFNMAAGGSAWGNDSTFDLSGNLAISDTTSWHHILVVIDRSDNAKCKMYVDGADRTDRIKGNILRMPAIVNTLNLRIGTESDNNASFIGTIDEAVIAFAARSAAWVKLCYMNQKENDALVNWHY